MKKRKDTKGTIKEYEEITQRPLVPHEAFMIQGGGFFGRQVSTLLNARKVKLNQDPSLTEFVERGRLEWVYEEKTGRLIDVEFVRDDGGPILIFEHPEWKKNEPDGYTGEPIEGMYKAATDSYDRDEANTSTSRGSVHVLKDFYNADYSSGFWAARLIERPEEAEMFFENSAKLVYYYFAMNLIEYSNLRIFDWYKKNGFEYLLRERPEFVLSAWIRNSKVENKYGIDPNTKIHWLGLLKKKLLDPVFVNQIYDIEAINAFLKFKLDPKYNCDITISAALTAVQEQEDKEIIVNEEKPLMVRKPMPVYVTINGRLVKHI